MRMLFVVLIGKGVLLIKEEATLSISVIAFKYANDTNEKESKVWTNFPLLDLDASSELCAI